MIVTTEDRLQVFMAECRERIALALDRWLPTADTTPFRLHQAMRYATLGDGKRVRPVLVYATGDALGIDRVRLDGAACAVELIHAYSLVHDDLPAMDDDDLRRGRPTCHKAYDEPTAVLVGDALQSLAFQVLATDPAMAVPAQARLEMVEVLSRAAGSRGMAGGQALDPDAEGRSIDSVELENIHIHKTGALIRASVRMAATLGNAADPGVRRSLDHYAKCVGLAFQVRDDILDVEGETAILGKTPGKDERQDKATYPALLGLDAAREKAALLCEESLSALDGLDGKADALRWISQYIVGRNH